MIRFVSIDVGMRSYTAVLMSIDPISRETRIETVYTWDL